MDDHIVYRHFNKEGELLYIGCSQNFHSRHLQHKKNAHWYKSVVSITLTHFDERQPAFEHELNAIKTENPKHNRHFSVHTITMKSLRDIGISEEMIREFIELHRTDKDVDTPQGNENSLNE